AAGVLVSAPATGGLTGVLCGVLVGVTVRVTVGADVRRVPVSLRALSYPSIAGPLFGLLALLLAPDAAPADTAIVAVAFGVASGMTGGVGDWVLRGLGQLRLLLHGWLPVRLNTFVNDAYERGVLRRNGPVLQFRHALIQDYLTGIVRVQQLLDNVERGG